MLYDQTGHRVKEPFNYITWVHTVLKIEPYNLNQCLFGEHLLNGGTLPVAIVESEKTVCIASIYLPQFIWLACGQLQGLNADNCKVLSGRTVLLFPDLKGFDKWQQKAKELESQIPDVRFVVSDYLEKNASEVDKAKGLDLADYLIQFDVSDFRLDVPEKPDNEQPAAAISDWQLNDQKWIWINRMHNGSADVPAWLTDAKDNLLLFRNGRLDYPAYVDKQADVILKYHINPEIFVSTVNDYINSLN